MFFQGEVIFNFLWWYCLLSQVLLLLRFLLNWLMEMPTCLLRWVFFLIVRYHHTVFSEDFSTNSRQRYIHQSDRSIFQLVILIAVPILAGSIINIYWRRPPREKSNIIFPPPPTTRNVEGIIIKLNYQIE